MSNSLRGKRISETYPKLVQIVNGVLYDGTGTVLPISTAGFGYQGPQGSVGLQGTTGVRGVSGGTGPQGFQGPSASGGSIEVTSITYSEFVSKAQGASLSIGNYYIINDFRTCYDQPDYNYDNTPITSGNYKEGNISPIMVFAVATDQISEFAYQPEYPGDVIQYDYTFSTTEVTGGTAFGRIIHRKDNQGNSFDYDFREVLFKRYDAYVSEQVYDGTISLSIIVPFPGIVEGSITGVGTTFTNFSAGDIIGVLNINSNVIDSDPIVTYYEILSIANDTNMLVTGSVFIEVNNTRLVGANLLTGMSWKKNNVTSNTNEYEYLTFTDSSQCFSNTSSNTAEYSKWEEYTFLLPNNVFRGGAYIDNSFGNGFRNNTFNDNCDSNVVRDDFYNNIITNDFDHNTINDSFYNNVIELDFTNNLVMGSFYNNNLGDDNTTNFENNIFKGTFYNNYYTGYDEFRYNTLNGDFYQNIVLELFVFNAFDLCNLNTFGRGFYRNRVGDNFYSNTIYHTVSDNSIGNQFTDNAIGTPDNLQSFELNSIGYGFSLNTIEGDFRANNIGYSFDSNTIQGGFDYNNIFNEFKGNLMSSNFSANTVDSYVSGNEFDGPVEANTIGSYTISNNFLGYVFDNSWDSDFYSNTIGDNFISNKLGGDIYENTIGSEFQQNQIGNYFYDNMIGDGFGYGGSSPRGNRIGNNFYSNQIGEYFYDNIIPDNFFNNTVGYYFQWNVVNTSINGVDFTLNNGNITGISYVGLGASAADGTYNGISGSVSIGPGSGASFDAIVSGGTVSSVTLISAGTQYVVGDTITILGTSIGGVTGVIEDFTSDAIGQFGINGTYTNIIAGGTGSGENASFDITVTDGLISDIQLNNGGEGYKVNDPLTLPLSVISNSGTASISVTVIYSNDLLIGVTGTGAAPSVYEPYTCQIFKRSDETNRLSFYDGNDILTIKNIDE
jgi:hypothetical protein